MFRSVLETDALGAGVGDGTGVSSPPVEVTLPDDSNWSARSTGTRWERSAGRREGAWLKSLTKSKEVRKTPFRTASQVRVKGRRRIPRVRTPRRRRWLGYPASAVLVGLTIGGLKLFPRLTGSSVALLLLLSVFLSAWIWESGPGVLAAVLATAGFNFFFIPPLYTFTVEDPSNVAALVVFLASGLLIGRLSSTSRERLRLVEAERGDLANMTRLSEAFLSDTTRESLLGVAADRLRGALQARHVSILLGDEHGHLVPAAATSDTGVRSDLAELAFRQGNSADFPSTFGGTDIYLPVPV